MNTYRLKIVTPEKKLFDGEVLSVTVPGADGLLTVLAGHEAMVALLNPGIITIRTAENDLEGEAGPGFLEVSHNEAAVMIRAFHWMYEPIEEPEPIQHPDADEMRKEGSLRKLKESSKPSAKRYEFNENTTE